MTVRGGGDPSASMAAEPPCRMGPPPRSFAADAHGCIMVRVPRDPPNTSSRREIRAADGELPSDRHARITARPRCVERHIGPEYQRRTLDMESPIQACHTLGSRISVAAVPPRTRLGPTQRSSRRWRGTHQQTVRVARAQVWSATSWPLHVFADDEPVRCDDARRCRWSMIRACANPHIPNICLRAWGP